MGSRIPNPESRRSFSEAEIAALKEQIGDWYFILGAYETDLEAGIEAYDTKDERCSLCGHLKAHDLTLESNRLFAVLKCRRCPIVRATGLTCMHHFEASGYPKDFYLDRDMAIEVCGKVIEFLKRISDTDFTDYADQNPTPESRLPTPGV